MRGVGGDEPRARRSGLHADAVLAGPDLAHPQLGAPARPRPVRVQRPSPREVRRALIDLSSGGGFWEHYSPLTGRGQGGEQFAWTAGLVLEVLATELERGEGWNAGERRAHGYQRRCEAHRRTEGVSIGRRAATTASIWEQTFDRRSLLGKAAVAGGLLAAGGRSRRRAARRPVRPRRPARSRPSSASSAPSPSRRASGSTSSRASTATSTRCSRRSPLPTQFVDRVRAEAKAGKGNIDLLVGLHGDFVTFQNEGLIRGVGDVATQIKTLPPALVKHREARARRRSTTSRTRRRRT